MRTETRTGIRYGTALAALALAAVAGCGGDSGGGSSGDSSSGGGGGQAAQPSGSPNAADQMHQWVRCMREHGVNLPEDDSDNSFAAKPPGGAAALDAAQTACRRYAPAKLGGGDDAAAADRELAIARCLRQNGVDVADPQPGQSVRLPAGANRDERVLGILDRCLKPAAGKSG